jgi:hypothetical protein
VSVTTCANCGRPRLGANRFCIGCGRPFDTAPPAAGTSPAPSPPAAYAPIPARRPRAPLSAVQRKLLFEIALLAALALAVASLVTPWWSFAYSSGGGSESVNFVPGVMYSVTCAGSGCGGFASGTFSYSNFGAGTSALYAAALVVAAVATVFAGLVALIYGLEGVRSRTYRVPRARLFRFLCVLGALLAVGMTIAVAAAQSSSFVSGATFPGTTSGGPSPTNSFWGSSHLGATSASWGAGVGWYCAIAAALLLLGALLALLAQARSARDEGALRAPVRVAVSATVVAAPLGAEAGTESEPPSEAPSDRVPASTGGFRAPPSATPRVRPAPVSSGPSTAGATVACPACGFENSAKSRNCSYCQRPLH